MRPIVRRDCALSSYYGVGDFYYDTPGVLQSYQLLGIAACYGMEYHLINVPMLYRLW